MIVTQSPAESRLLAYIRSRKPVVDRALRDNLPLAPPEITTEFNAAVEYLIFPGGKRLRPILTMLGAELFGGNPEDVLHAAAAVEFIHTSSLIFDDLPHMDNSPTRRGRPALHEKFGEGLSTLVAIGFLNHSYRLVTLDGGQDGRRAVDAILEVVNCIGPAGMVGGQSIDLNIQRAECRFCAIRDSRELLNLKTSSLIRLCLSLGAIHAGAEKRDIEILSSFANCLGHAYQLSDDIIDDDDIFEPDSLRSELLTAADRAKRILLDNFPPSNARSCLIEFVDYVTERKS